jgi:hypothetical protein
VNNPPPLPRTIVETARIFNEQKLARRQLADSLIGKDEAEAKVLCEAQHLTLEVVEAANGHSLMRTCEHIPNRCTVVITMGLIIRADLG